MEVVSLVYYLHCDVNIIGITKIRTGHIRRKHPFKHLREPKSTEPAKGHARKKFVSRAHEIRFFFLHVPSRAPYICAETVNCFKSRLNNFWKNEDIIYDYQSDIYGTGNRK